MNSTLYKAVGVVTLALIFYSIAIITEQRHSKISIRVLIPLVIGVVFDITSTGLMIAGSGNIPITPHGLIGYSALAVMLVETVLVWRLWARNRRLTKQNVCDIPHRLHIYTRAAYSWWVIAYIAGAIISMTIT